MSNYLQVFRDSPVVAGMAFFIAVSLFLAVVFGVLMRRAGASLRPLVFFFGFLAIVGGPQAMVHLLNAHLVTSKPVAEPTNGPNAAVSPTAQTAVPALQPAPWNIVFGPQADPALITDARQSLATLLTTASEAKLSFNASGETALAARFASAKDAAAALDAYGRFFQFGNVSGSDAAGWTAQRFRGQGEWNHVVVAGNELYAWTGPSRDSVVANRVRTLGAYDDSTPASDLPSQASAPLEAAPAADWLRQRPLLLGSFVVVNLLFAVGWFFKGSAWATRTAPRVNAPAVDATVLRQRLLALNTQPEPVSVRSHDDSRRIEINWRYGDAQWLDLMRVHKMRRTHRLVLAFDENDHTVRVREFWSAFDASAGAEGVSLAWKGAMGMDFFNIEHQRVLGVQLDSRGRPTGELSKSWTFNLQALKQPVIDVVTSNGWTWQPVMFFAPVPLRWLMG